MSAEWIRTAKVGDKVWCVDATWDELRDQRRSPLVHGAVYTILSLGMGRGVFHDGTVSEDIAVELVEVKNPADKRKDGHPGFYWKRFRPVRPTSIDIFTDMLKTTPADQPMEVA
jgi:hypothetical protein